MSGKEWREVGRQSLYFLLAAAGMVLLAIVGDRLSHTPISGERIAILLGLWLLMFSMFMGLSPFAMDSKQKGMEYLLTLPYSRRRLLLIKLLPRLAAVILFYLAFAAFYGLAGNAAFGGGFTVFSLTCFALFLISFSLAVVHENFIIQSLWAGVALCGYLALCLWVCVLGFAWKFDMPASWIEPRIWAGLSYDTPTLLVSIAVFMLLATPFIVSFFLAFKKFDLKPARTFNRRQFRLFLPQLLVACAVAMGVTYLVQSHSPGWEPRHFLLSGQRLLKADFPGKLTLFAEDGRRAVDTKSKVSWARLLLEQERRLFMSGFDRHDGSRIIGYLDKTDLSWKVLHRIPRTYAVANGDLGIRFDGANFVYLYSRPTEQGGLAEGVRPSGAFSAMHLVWVDPASGQSKTLGFQTPSGGRNNEPWLMGSDECNGRRYWLVALRGPSVLRLWADGRCEELGLSERIPVYAGGLLFTFRRGSLVVIRLLESGIEIVKEIPGNFGMGNPYFFSLGDGQASEVYAERDERIVRIDLATMSIDDVGPARGFLHRVPPGDFYFVEFENWPPQSNDKWNKLYRLKGGRMILLKQFDFNEAGHGYLIVNANGVEMIQSPVKDGKVAKATQRFFAFPDLRELRFKGLD
ncbi:MAG TPA: hypothetical protein PK919_02900 [Candidatus Aminicenantes bacterium]|nr:hypothetical protein [Candidatus Aminicenantes bacterium]